MKNSLLSRFESKRKSVEERLKEGKDIRKKIPRLRQGDFKPSSKRVDPVAILQAQAKTRIPELVPVRYARMLTSQFAFLRGSATIMAADLSNSGNTTGINVQCCGDMHVANFGVFASAERNLVFGINDFDESLPGPWEWDLKRLVTSIVVAARFLGASEIGSKEGVFAAVSSYRKKMREFAFMGNLELWYSTIGEKEIFKSLPPSATQGAKKIINKARQHTHMQVLNKLTDLIDDRYLLRENPPFIIRPTHTLDGRTVKEALGRFLESYLMSLNDDRIALLSQYRIVDAVRKVVGVGSVGTRCWVIFLTGNTTSDPLFLQVKEAQPSVLQPYTSKSVYKNEGQRVVAGQRLIQSAPDIFLGWGTQNNFHFYVRQLRDMKGGVEFEPDKVKLADISNYCALCGWALALAHAKSGDPALISGYAGKSDELDEAMSKFAFAYAEQNEKDYNRLFKEQMRGTIEVAHA